MKNITYITYVNVVLAFSVMLFGTTLYATLWAEVFASDWRAVSWSSEMPDILALAVLATFLYIAWSSLYRSRTRSLLSFGICLVALKILFELPLDKYHIVFPLFDIHRLFLFFDTTELLGMFVILFSFSTLLRKESKP